MGSTAARPTAYEANAPSAALVRKSLADSRHRVFWTDDVGAVDTYPPVMAPERADLVIVGGGYLGLWTAVHAIRREATAKVILLEAHSVGWAASGRNGGFCDASLTHGPENGRSRWPDEYDTIERLGAENLDAFERDVTDLGLRCEWERTGATTIAVEAHQVDWLDPDRRLDRDAVRARIDSPLALAGQHDPDTNAMVHPARLAHELARAASDAGVVLHENSPVVEVSSPKSGPVQVHTERAVITASKVVLATNVFPSLLRRTRMMTVPVYDYVLMTEPLSAEHRAGIGWAGREGLADMANQFHYSRLTADDRILYGGYDAVYHRGGKLRASYEDRPETFEKLASHMLATFPQLEGIRFTHRWAGAIDTSTRFAAFYGLARQGRVAYAAGFTGLGVGATRFAGEVLLDLLDGTPTERTELEMVRRPAVPFPPEPLAGWGIDLTRWSMDRADHRQGRRNPFLRALDAVGLGFDS